MKVKKDKRQNKRITYKDPRPAAFCCLYKQGTVWEPCDILNLSSGGICMQVKSGTTKNNQILILLETDIDIFMLEGQVVYVKDSIIGVEFNQFAPMLNSLLETQLKKPANSYAEDGQIICIFNKK